MSTVIGALPLFDLEGEHWTKLVSLGYPRPPGLKRVFVVEDSFGAVEPLAVKLSKRLGGPVLALSGQSVADAYMLSEFDGGQRVRELCYVRDDEAGWTIERGLRREWERDFHFGEKLEHARAHLDDPDSGWSEAQIEMLLRAHGARDLALLPKLPNASMGKVFALLKANGILLATGEGVIRRKGLLARLFG